MKTDAGYYTTSKSINLPVNHQQIEGFCRKSPKIATLTIYNGKNAKIFNKIEKNSKFQRGRVGR
ncbi:MAG: hypothetical protein AMJ53_16785 [Gammaproteobacteria bacterium SG8_11]|nr:MAG: hypothetical protein AMJ53_16785 [Gammaproteobacteria bacterium SG8_11]